MSVTRSLTKFITGIDCPVSAAAFSSLFTDADALVLFGTGSEYLIGRGGIGGGTGIVRVSGRMFVPGTSISLCAATSSANAFATASSESDNIGVRRAIVSRWVCITASRILSMSPSANRAAYLASSSACAFSRCSCMTFSCISSSALLLNRAAY